MADSPPRRRLRRFAIALVIFMLLLVVLVGLAPLIVAKTNLRQVVLARVLHELNGTPTAGSASFSWFTPIELHDVTVIDPSGRVALTAAKVTSSKTLFDLARDSHDLGTFTFEQAVLEVVCEADTTNIEQAIANWLSDDGAPPTPQRTGVILTTTGGRVRLKEAGHEEEHVLDSFGLTLTVPRPRSEPVTLALSAGAPGELNLAFTFGPETEAKLTADHFPLQELQSLLHRVTTGTTIGGQLTADLTARWGDGTTVDLVARQVALNDFDLAGPWLGPDQLHLQKAELLTRPEQPFHLMMTAGELHLEHADLSCDAGRLVIAATIKPDDVAGSLLSRPDQTINADVDLAKLATLLPRLFRVREGIVLQEGRIAAHLQSRAAKSGTEWSGAIRSTSLKGTRNGQPIVWDKPLVLEFAGHLRPDGWPSFDKLQCQSDFIGLAARGSVEDFIAAANVDLDRLSARLSEFVNLGGARLTGTARLDLRSRSNPGGGISADGSVKLVRFAFQDAAGHGLQEPELMATVRATGKLGHPLRLDTGNVTMAADGDQLTLALLEPVADLRAARTGTLSAKVSGDVGRWWKRIDPWLGLPATWQVGGTGNAAGVVALTADGVRVDHATVDLTKARFRGAGVDVDEPTLKAESGLTWERKTGSIVLNDVRLSCETVGLSSRRLDVKPIPGGYGLTGTALVTANVNRVQRLLHLPTDEALGGMAKGTIGFDSSAGPMKFTSDLTINQFTYGPPARPTWSEPWVKLTATGNYDPAGDRVQFDALKLERTGLSADAKGSVTKLASTRDFQLAGTLAYDLSRLEPQLKAYLGKSAHVVGKESRPFDLAGQLGVPQSALLASLRGSAAVAWQEVRAYGFDIGPAELRAALDRGTVKMNPIEATFGGGKVRLQPTLALTKDYDLSFAKGRVVDHAKLTPAACASALGFALPAIAHATQADGLMSLDLAENHIPLTDPDHARMRGKLTVHTATVSPGPLVSEIATLLGAKQTKLTLANEQVVPIRVENGRVYHENFAITLGQSVLHTSGSVGLDGSLALVLDLPLPPRVLQQVLAHDPQLRDSLAKQRIKIAVGGTLDRPQLDARSFETALQGVVRGAARSAVGDLLKKGEGKLLGELQKRLK